MFACDKSLISSCLSSDNIKGNANIQSGFQDLEHLVKSVQRNSFNGAHQQNSYKVQNLKSKGVTSIQCNPYDKLDTLSSLGNYPPLTPSNASDLKSHFNLTFKTASSPIRHDPSYNKTKNNQRMFEIEKMLSPKKMVMDRRPNYCDNSKPNYLNNSSQFLGQASFSSNNNKLKKKINIIINEQASKPKIPQCTPKYDNKPALREYKPQLPSQRVNTENFYSPLRFNNPSKFGLLDLAQSPKQQELKSTTNKLNIYDKYLDRDSVCKFKDEFKYNQQVSLFERTFSEFRK